MYPLFDSRNELYKSTQKALAAGDVLRLRLLLHNATSAHLNIWCDTSDYKATVPLVPQNETDGGRFFGAQISLDAGLYWYNFTFTTADGSFTVGKGEHSIGVIGSNSAFQLTVYEKNFTTPYWLKGGIIYQIFPDRFYRSQKADIKDVPADRFIQNDWSAQPAWQQGDTPCRLNNDYYGGNLKGVTEKLDYLASLGVSCIYLNPIFEAHSNHRYNTADYMKIDPLLGCDKDLKQLCRAAKKKGIAVILDGVFSHTGDDSIYFNKYSRYNSVGAYNSQNSPYKSWFNFSNWPDSYASWWGIDTLPETNENDPAYSEFICGKNGVIRRWVRCGISGWRLDVADELPDSIIEKMRTALKAEKKDALLLGEVWEDASNKFSYGARRKFLLGNQLDSVMNYPFAEGIIAFVKGGKSRDLTDLVLQTIENYPDCVVHSLMNHIGTHDTARALTRLGSDSLPHSREQQAGFALTDEQLASAKKKLKLAAALQYTLPGVPSIYYGDEAGLQGGKDPFCRAPFPWDNADTELYEFYKMLGTIRRQSPCFINGDFIPLPDSDLGHIAFLRQSKNNTLLICVNRWCDKATINLPPQFKTCKALWGNEPSDRKITVSGEDFFIGICE